MRLGRFIIIRRSTLDALREERHRAERERDLAFRACDAWQARCEPMRQMLADLRHAIFQQPKHIRYRIRRDAEDYRARRKASHGS